jgi:hypothetical protein
MIEQEQKPHKRIREMTPEEFRAYKRASMERSRKRKRAEQEAEKAIEATRQVADVHEFWAANRAMLSETELAEKCAQHERVLDQMHWLKHGDKVDPNDPDFVSLSEGVEDLVAFVRENPSPHLGYITKSEDIPPDWSSRKFWKNASLMSLLCGEGEATTAYVKYGFLIGVSDALVHRFLTDRAGWSFEKVSDLLGWHEDSNSHVKYK